LNLPQETKWGKSTIIPSAARRQTTGAAGLESGVPGVHRNTKGRWNQA
jgi:hypothetical protein